MVPTIIVFIISLGFVYKYGYQLGYDKGHDDAIDKMQKVPVRK